MKNKALTTIAILAAFCLLTLDVSAQCAMCKAAVESNMRGGGGDPQGLNGGILYMLLMPYLLVGAIGYWWWRNRRQEREQATDMTEDDFAQYQ